MILIARSGVQILCALFIGIVRFAMLPDSLGVGKPNPRSAERDGGGEARGRAQAAYYSYIWSDTFQIRTCNGYRLYRRSRGKFLPLPPSFRLDC